MGLKANNYERNYKKLGKKSRLKKNLGASYGPSYQEVSHTDGTQTPIKIKKESTTKQRKCLIGRTRNFRLSPAEKFDY